ncbi:MAG: glycosyltransferase [Bacteroidetes bacterium]|nr:glycosyltransferase [Bacteroidota bacterium]
MNKVLIISYYFPPMGMGGVQRTLKFAKYLKDYGWESVVVTENPKKYYAVDESLLKEAVECGINIERTGKEPFNVKDIIVKAPNERVRKLKTKFSQFFFIPDSKIFWKKKALAKVDEIWNKYGGFDLIFATAPPYTDFLIGQAIKRKYKIPLVIDYRDLWVDNKVLNSYPTYYHKMSNIRLEKKVLSEANKIITTNRKTKELIITRYGNVEYNDVKIIPHGFDQEDYDKAVKEELPVTDKMRFLYSGSFYCYNPRPYFDAIKFLYDKYPELEDKIEFCFLGQFTPEYVKYCQHIKIYDKITVKGYVDHFDCVKYIVSSDVLVLLKSTGENEIAAMVGKVGEYIGSRKNILALIPDGLTQKTLQGYEAIKFENSEEPRDIAKSIYEYYLLYKENKMPAASEDFIAPYNRKTMTDDLATEFNYLLDIE